MNRALKIALALVGVVLLVLVRAFETHLFYDPLIVFFKVDHSTEALPAFDSVKLILNVALRFGLNTLISLGILWVLFQKREILKVATGLYVVVYLILLIAFIWLLQSSEEGGHLALFYVRRFLIQPVFLLLLIPAFYFQKKA
ncbi:MAG: exosortase F system-associated protein [Flavobacteriaceae bacterium]|nr:exosortase F system-associated protein [Flavobacteriaceae bacterium]